MCMDSVGRVYTAPAVTDVLVAPSHHLFAMMTVIVSIRTTGSSDENIIKNEELIVFNTDFVNGFKVLKYGCTLHLDYI